MPAVLLAYNFEEKELKALRALCRRMDVRLKAAKREEYFQPVGAFIGQEKRIEADPDAPALAGQMLVFCQFPEKQFSAFYTQLRNARLAPDALKAVLTETNAKWDAYTLYAQLADEQRRMREAVEKVKEDAAQAKK